jgi:hypothetical protein
MADNTSTIRFKRDGVEFELTSSQEDVARAWASLEESIVGAFKAPPSRRGASGGGEAASQEGARRTQRRKASGAGGGASASQDDVRTKITQAQLDDFPELGTDPSALVVGYAVLRWARDKLGIEELTAPHIYAVSHDRLRVPHTVSAYREAFRVRPRAVHKNTAVKPQSFKLMNPGDQALDTYLSSLAAGGTAAEAEAKAAEAEAEASE